MTDAGIICGEEFTEFTEFRLSNDALSAVEIK
jgi:hypothetical protein